MTQNKTIKVDYLARVEGEGSLKVVIRDGKVRDVQLKIFEPPRFFEAFLRGRRFTEAPDITARICGICPVAYQMSSIHAMERGLGIVVPGPIRELRRLLYCGEWIESHALHIALLHAPDFLGFESAVHMAKVHPDVVKLGLEIKKLGNEIVERVGGREIHPVNVKVGGFYRSPRRDELAVLGEKLPAVIEKAEGLVRWVAGFDFPDFETDHEQVSLVHPAEYPFNEGRLISTRGLDLAPEEFETVFEERHVAHSNALHCVIKERGSYQVGPLARYTLNHDRLTERCRALAREVGLGPTCRNPFKSIIVRSLETLYALEEAQRIITSYQEPEQPSVPVPARAAVGHAVTEAPRGLLYHRYRIDEEGLIQEAQIIPPTSQNQLSIEDDLRTFVTPRVDLPHAQLRHQCEQAVRNYDPCISCATHFLQLEVVEEKPGT